MLQGHADSTPRTSLDSSVSVLKSDGQRIPDQLVLHKTLNAPIEARYGRSRTLLLTPWTAEIVGQPSEQTRAFFNTVERIHRSLGLGMQSALGRDITREWNRHTVIGIWTAFPLLFIIVTGIIISYPWASNLLFK